MQGGTSDGGDDRHEEEHFHCTGSARDVSFRDKGPGRRADPRGFGDPGRAGCRDRLRQPGPVGPVAGRRIVPGPRPGSRSRKGGGCQDVLGGEGALRSRHRGPMERDATAAGRPCGQLDRRHRRHGADFPARNDAGAGPAGSHRGCSPRENRDHPQPLARATGRVDPLPPRRLEPRRLEGHGGGSAARLAVDVRAGVRQEPRALRQRKRDGHGRRPGLLHHRRGSHQLRLSAAEMEAGGQGRLQWRAVMEEADRELGIPPARFSQRTAGDRPAPGGRR